MKFISLDGSNVRADTITAVRLGDAKAADSIFDEMKPRVIVDFGNANHSNCIAIKCETVEERDALAAAIMDEITAAIANP